VLSKEKRRSATNAAAPARDQHNFIGEIECVNWKFFHFEATGEFPAEGCLSG